MILRKPYAFLIRHFKLIHIILAFCIGYLLYKNYNIYAFIRDFLYSGESKVALNSAANLFDLLIFILPWIIILGCIIILVILFRKKKPTIFYIVNIIMAIVTIAIDNYLYKEILYMETNIVEAQYIKLMQDLSFILFVSELVTFVVVFVRGVGLDIKKFDFGKDLIDLELKEEDNEEFEVEFKFDSSLLKRGFKKNKRYFKYFYVEHKFVINVIVFTIFLGVGFTVYYTKTIKEQHYNEGDSFAITNGIINVRNSYITTKDSRGNVIASNGNVILVLEIGVTGNNTTINLARLEADIKGKAYYSKGEYAKQLLDLGEVYKNQDIYYGENYDYILTYEVPEKYIHENIYLKYLNDYKISVNKVTPDYTKVLLSPTYLDDNPTVLNVDIKDKVAVDSTAYGNTTMQINSLALGESFTLNYKYCVSTDDCYSSKEYVKPTLTTNYDKAILKIEGSLSIDPDITNKKIKNLYNLITYFGKLEYVIEGETYEITSFTQVEPTKLKENNVYYLEVDKDVLKSKEVYFKIKLRNREYTYSLFE